MDEPPRLRVMEWVEGARAEGILSRWLASVVDENGEEEEEEDRSR